MNPYFLYIERRTEKKEESYERVDAATVDPKSVEGGAELTSGARVEK